MYCGSVNVAQEDLSSFLAVAEDLKVRGLTQNLNKDAGSSASKNGTGVGKRSNPGAAAAATPAKKFRPSSLLPHSSFILLRHTSSAFLHPSPFLRPLASF